MNLQFMRLTDRAVGIPVCLLLSLWRALIGWLPARRAKSANPRTRMLFIELSEMGSIVAALPAIQSAGATHAHPEAHFLTFAQNRACIEMLGIIPHGNVLTIDPTSVLSFLRTVLQCILRMRTLKIDICVDLELFSRISAILSYLSGAKERVGFHRYTQEGLYRGNLLTRPVTYNPYHHIAHNFLALVDSLRAERDDLPLVKKAVDAAALRIPHVTPEPEATESVRKRLTALHPGLSRASKIVLINPNAGRLLPIRAWPIENYGALATELLVDANTFVVIIGTDEATNDATWLKQEIADDRLLDFTAQTDLKELIALMHLSGALVTNDSGPAHFAALTPIHVVTLFGPETPVLYAPLTPNAVSIHLDYACSPCLSAYNHRSTVCRDNRCLQDIPVAKVLQAVTGYLAERGQTNDTPTGT